MSSLIITKQTGNFFSLVLDGGSEIISEQNRITTVGNFCNFKTANGANLILKQNILYSEITIITGGSHVPTSIYDLWLSLISAGFFDGLGASGSGTGANNFTDLLDTFPSYLGRDGQVLIVNESMQRVETIAVSLFSASDKTKLDGIETGAQANVNADCNETDPANDKYIENKPNLLISLQFIDYPLITVAATQTFTIPTGATAKQVFLNDGVQYPATANNTDRANTFTQTGSVVTLNQTTEINNYIAIFYQ